MTPAEEGIRAAKAERYRPMYLHAFEITDRNGGTNLVTVRGLSGSEDNFFAKLEDGLRACWPTARRIKFLGSYVDGQEYTAHEVIAEAMHT